MGDIFHDISGTEVHPDLKIGTRGLFGALNTMVALVFRFGLGFGDKWESWAQSYRDPSLPARAPIPHGQKSLNSVLTFMNFVLLHHM